MAKHYHFIGVGGIGMSALAFLVMHKGCTVSGSDVRSNKVTEQLAEQGAKIFIGHAPGQIAGSDCVIYSSAIEDMNPELAEARRKNIPIMQRAQLLAELTDGYTSITVAGAHGKTTTSSMIARLLTDAGLNPATAVGGIVQDADSHAQWGEGKYFVTEVDESDGSFLCFHPDYSVITNVDLEHVDYYRNWEKVLDAYGQFIRQTAEGGTIIACGDDPYLPKLLEGGRHRVRTFGLTVANDVSADNIAYDGFHTTFDCIADGKKMGAVRLNVPGQHNVLNALAAITLGLCLDIDFETIAKNLGHYKGVQRRFQLKDKVRDIWVIDDYAHHPTEITSILDTAQTFKQGQAERGRLITIVQPHRYSRLQALMDDFAQSLVNTDVLIITDVYAASEEEVSGVSSEILYQKACALTDNPVHYLPKNILAQQLIKTLKPHDIVLTLGAGDITAIADDIVKLLKGKANSVERAQL